MENEEDTRNEGGFVESLYNCLERLEQCWLEKAPNIHEILHPHVDKQWSHRKLSESHRVKWVQNSQMD